ncbi:general transcription factor IIH subunit 1-like [Tubulanus polymorphus]|uniref:general transcription factor IIH subunit 1-like n=1 Tax=Tubulanus polymorphus TaxID=672921 RepID=UPI003DA6423B
MSISEDVLSITKNVKQKKVEGSLYLMSERLAWMPGHLNTFRVSHNYADIKVQKISPDSKEKVQLQIILHDNGANTFQFNNPAGRAAQIKDRDAVKELLQKLLPNFRRKVNSELEEKNRMLQEDPELFQLYKDLVVSGVITAEEFWAERTKKNKKANNQSVGVSAAFLSEIKPQADGCNGLRYNLTADIIQSIFRTYPAVKQLHAEYVPDKLNESDFWTKFFQSHYFHRDRINLNNKDLFAQCAKADEQDIQEEISRSVNDPFIDLTHLTDTHLNDEGYGVLKEEARHKITPANLSLIRRFNHHSTMVLKSLESAGESTSVGGDSSVKNNGEMNAANKESNKEPPCKKKKLKEKIEYDDLQGNDEQTMSGLKLAKLERYLHGPTPITATSYTTNDDMIRASNGVTQEIEAYRPDLTRLLSSQQAISVSGELSPGGALMHGTTQQQLAQMVPTNMLQEIRQVYSALCELLRHFWLCFPTTSPALEEKVVRMKANLERFQLAKMQPLRDKLDEYHYTINFTGHLNELLNAAFIKYDTWQSKRAGKAKR